MVGEILKKERERRNISLEYIASQTHIRRDYLFAVENNNFEKIPAEIYVRGYLRMYARILNIDEDMIMKMYCEERKDIQEPCEEEEEIKPEKGKGAHIIKIVSIGLAVLGVILYLAVKLPFFQEQAEQYDEKTALPPQEVLPDTPAVAEVPRQITRHVLKIQAIDTTWLMMVIDNEKVEEYILKQGDTLTREGSSGFYIKIGNAGGVNIFLDNENIGQLGKKGEVVKISLPDEFKLERKFKPLFKYQITEPS